MKSTASSSFVETPRLALRVGVVGNRKFGNDAEAGLGDPETCRDTAEELAGVVLKKIAAQLTELKERGDKIRAYHNDKPLLKITSCLAEGSDQIGARTAEKIRAESAANLEVQLHCVFPFPKESYPNEIDFKDPEAFNQLAKEAKQIIRLDGKFHKSESESNTEDDLRHKSERTRAYRASAGYLLQHSDILVAIWDVRATSKSGGTTETIREALRVGIPVIIVPPDPNNPVIRYLKRYKELDRTKAGLDWEQQLLNRLEKQIRFPDPREDEHSPASESDKTNAWTRSLECYEELTSTKPAPKTSLRGKLWSCFEGIFSGSEKIETPPPPKVQPYNDVRERAASLSRHYAGLYRGAFLASYLLAIVAVLMALSCIAFFYYHNQIGGMVCASLKLILIFALIFNRWRALSQQWQAKSADFRLLSEMLRPMNYLAPLAMTTPNSRIGAHYAPYDPRNSWPHWFFRALVRSQPMLLTEDEKPPADFQFTQAAIDPIKTSVVETWLPRQIHYHKNNSAKFHHMFHKIEKLNTRMLWTVVAAVAAHLLIDIIDKCHVIADHHSWVMMILLVASAFLPAVIAILTGLLYQADARRQEERSRVMSFQLEILKDSLAALQPHSRGCYSWQIATEIRDEVASKMIEEVADWQLLYRMDEVKAG